MDAEITISGIAELKRALADYNNQLANRVVAATLRQGANYMARHIRAAAPSRTGRLRRAIKVKNSKINRPRTNGKVGVFISISPGKNRKDTKGAWYGKFQEDGYTATGRVKGREVTTSATTRRERQEHKERTGKRLRVYRHHPGARHIEGRHFIRNTFHATKTETAQLIVSAQEIAARKLAQQIGFKTT